MILSLNKKESAALTLHMSIMRKSFKNIIKKRYYNERKEYLESFDYVHGKAKTALESCETHGFDFYTPNFNIQDIKILTEFLRAYLEKVENDTALNKVFSDVDKDQIEVLTKLWTKCDKMLTEVKGISV